MLTFRLLSDDDVSSSSLDQTSLRITTPDMKPDQGDPTDFQIEDADTNFIKVAGGDS